jgi:hypothetical protein
MINIISSLLKYHRRHHEEMHQTGMKMRQPYRSWHIWLPSVKITGKDAKFPRRISSPLMQWDNKQQYQWRSCIFYLCTGFLNRVIILLQYRQLHVVHTSGRCLRGEILPQKVWYTAVVGCTAYVRRLGGWSCLVGIWMHPSRLTVEVGKCEATATGDFTFQFQVLLVYRMT